MFKRFTVYSIPDGADGDVFWKYHTQVHARDIWKATSRYKTKYVLNRVKKTFYGNHDVVCFIETNWASEEDIRKDHEAITTIRLENGETISEDFKSRVKGQRQCFGGRIRRNKIRSRGIQKYFSLIKDKIMCIDMG